MKKTIKLMSALVSASLICATLLLSATGCVQDRTESGEPSTESSAESSAESSKEESKDMSIQESTPVSVAEESEPATERTWPYVTGTFLQPGAFTSYSVSAWEKHLDYLLEVGIDTVIVQWTATTPYGKYGETYYPAEATADEKSTGFKEYSDFTDRLLQAAQNRNVKVYLGLNLSDEWWTNEATKPEWYKNQAKVGKVIANRLYSLYKEKYPDAFYGWYFAWEYYNGIGHVNEVSDFLNLYLDELTVIDPSMPMLLSPFVRSGVTPAVTESEWKEIFALTRFRDGDIFCCQDAVGAGHITIDQMDSYFAAMKNVCDTVEGLIYWANNENFTQADWSSAPISRFVRQMEISAKYVTGHVTFAYSHYYSPDKGKASYHKAYKDYYETGKVDD